MKPIIQVSLDLTADGNRRLHPDQEFCGVIPCFGLISPKPLRQAVRRAANTHTSRQRFASFRSERAQAPLTSRQLSLLQQR